MGTGYLPRQTTTSPRSLQIFPSMLCPWFGGIPKLFSSACLGDPSPLIVILISIFSGECSMSQAFSAVSRASPYNSFTVSIASMANSKFGISFFAFARDTACVTSSTKSSHRTLAECLSARECLRHAFGSVDLSTNSGACMRLLTPNGKMTGPPHFAAKPPPVGVGQCRLAK